MRRYYDKENRRLVYIQQRATPDFWDSSRPLSNTGEFKKIVEGQRNNTLVLKTLKKYIPNKTGKILEGGCGNGRLVYCMQSNGYKCVGVDFARKTIERIKEVFPELDVRVGDVRDLQFPDSHFVAYWSLGVIEHFWDGYHDILEEMRRVLINGGYLLLSFPYMSPLRRLKAKFGLYEEFKGHGKEAFYQFALDAEVVIKDFESAGFVVMEKNPIAVLKGLKDELTAFRPIYYYRGKSLLVRGFNLILTKIVTTFAAHSLFLVLQKREIHGNSNI